MWSRMLILLTFLLFSMNAVAHTSFTFSIGGSPAYYPQPVYYYAPPVVQNTAWVPAHWENGYWVTGHYVEYVTPGPQPQIIWARGGYYRHHGHWYYS